MTAYRDLSEWTYFGPSGGKLRAVGWLEAGGGFTMGPSDKEFFAALVSLLVEPWQPATVAGRQECSFCQFSGGPGTLTFDGCRIQLGAANIFVPGDDVVYVAPSLIAHYIDSHGYQPPAEFRTAVLDCPRMKSMQYLKRLKDIGVLSLLRT